MQRTDIIGKEEPCKPGKVRNEHGDFSSVAECSSIILQDGMWFTRIVLCTNLRDSHRIHVYASPSMMDHHPNFSQLSFMGT